MGTQNQAKLEKAKKRIQAQIGIQGRITTTHPTPNSVLLNIHWQNGPSEEALTRILAEELQLQVMYHDNVVQSWPGLGVQYERTLTPIVYGYAHLAAALSGTCTECGDGDLYWRTWRHARNRPNPEEHTSHPNLQLLTHLGVPPEEIEALAETLAAVLGEDPLDGEEKYHALGHLPALIPVAKKLTRT